MKNFTYFSNNEYDLINPACEWLRKLGLKETRWILDAVWLINRNRIFSEWIKNK